MKIGLDTKQSRHTACTETKTIRHIKAKLTKVKSSLSPYSAHLHITTNTLEHDILLILNIFPRKTYGFCDSFMSSRIHEG